MEKPARTDAADSIQEIILQSVAAERDGSAPTLLRRTWQPWPEDRQGRVGGRGRYEERDCPGGQQPAETRAWR